MVSNERLWASGAFALAVFAVGAGTAVTSNVEVGLHGCSEDNTARVYHNTNFLGEDSVVIELDTIHGTEKFHTERADTISGYREQVKTATETADQFCTKRLAVAPPTPEGFTWGGPSVF